MRILRIWTFWNAHAARLNPMFRASSLRLSGKTQVVYEPSGLGIDITSRRDLSSAFANTRVPGSIRKGSGGGKDVHDYRDEMCK